VINSHKIKGFGRQFVKCAKCKNAWITNSEYKWISCSKCRYKFARTGRTIERAEDYIMNFIGLRKIKSRRKR